MKNPPLWPLWPSLKVRISLLVYLEEEEEVYLEAGMVQPGRWLGIVLPGRWLGASTWGRVSGTSGC